MLGVVCSRSCQSTRWISGYVIVKWTCPEAELLIQMLKGQVAVTPLEFVCGVTTNTTVGVLVLRSAGC